MLILAGPVLAYIYSAPIQVTNSSNTTAYPMLPITRSVNNYFMSINGFMETDALDTRVQTLAGAAQPHMVADNRLLFAVPIPASSSTNLQYTAGNSDLSAFKIIPGYGGSVTIPHAPSIELGDNFKIEFQGYVNTAAGTNKNLVFKDQAFRVWVSGEKQISASVYESGGWTTCNVTATDVLSNVHFVEVTGDVTNLKLYIDGTLKSTDNLTAGGVPVVPGSSWVLMQNNSSPYAEFFKIWVD